MLNNRDTLCSIGEKIHNKKQWIMMNRKLSLKKGFMKLIQNSKVSLAKNSNS